MSAEMSQSEPRPGNSDPLFLRPLVLLPAICLLLLAVHANTLDNEFLAGDDTLYVTENPRVAISSASELWRVFDPGDARTGRFVEYFPVRDALYALVYLGFGLTPWPYHALQILLHLGVCLAVFFCTRDWLGSRAGLVAAAVFAVHPVHVESIAWVSTLKDPLFSLFLLLALLLYWRYLKAGRRRWIYYAAALVCLAVSLLCKSIGLVLPGLLVLVDLAFTRRRRLRELVLDKLPFVLVAGVMLIHFLVIGYANRVIINYPGGTPLSGFLTMTTVFVRYLIQLFAPTHLSARYVIEPVLSPATPIFLLSLAALFGLWVAAVLVRRRSRVPLFALAWITLCLLPVMNILPIPIEMADRYLYLPSVGFCVALGALLRRWGWHKLPGIRAATAGLVLLTVGAFSWLTMQRNDVWQDSVTLWADVVRQAPQFYIGHNNLASAYLARGQPKEALVHLRRSLAIDPRHARTHHNLGELLRRQGRLAAAERSFRRAVRLDPDNAKTHNSLGAIYLKQNRLVEARQGFDAALAVKRNYWTAHRNLAMTCMVQGDSGCAVKHMELAVRLRPHSANYLNDLFTVLSRANQARRALRWRSLLSHRHRDRPGLWVRWGALAEQAHDLDAAEAAYQHALSVAPDYYGALLALGMHYGEQRLDRKKGRAYLERALPLLPRTQARFVRRQLSLWQQQNPD
jgi:Tfp pilus assembly protein PilF